MLHVEKMTSADFSFAVELANTMDWNMAKEDFELGLKLEPEGCFVLRDGGKRAGIATCISFGKIGWFGNLVVDEGYRRKGGGEMLVRQAFAHLRSRCVETIGIYAYQHLIKFYERLGFRPNKEFSVFEGKVKKCDVTASLKKISKKETRAVLKFDKDSLGGDRARLLEGILSNEHNHCYVSKHDGQISGYIASKEHDAMTEIGPLVCRCEAGSVAKSLLTSVLSKLVERDAFVCLPTSGKSLTDILAQTGLKESVRLTRMFLGPAITENCTYIAESLERG